jgi:trehalose 6-phosphate phosphatase
VDERAAPAASAAMDETASQSDDVQTQGIARLAAVLERRPFALFTDIDGTISPLAPTPDAAVVSPRARSLLRALATRVHVVVITGRAIVDARRMVGLSNVAYVGSHGLATWIDGREELDASLRPYAGYAQQALHELAPLRRLDGVLFEDKGTGVALHYRLTRDAEEARAAILRAVAASGSAAHFDLLEGLKVVELRPRLGVNKGTSVRALVNRLRFEGLIYLGDDLTDAEAFEAIRDLRRGVHVDGLSIAVRQPEASPLVEAAADLVVEGVAGAEQVLAYAARRLGATTHGEAIGPDSGEISQ